MASRRIFGCVWQLIVDLCVPSTIAHIKATRQVLSRSYNMVAAIAHLLVSVISAILVSAAPLFTGQNITTLSLNDVSEFTPYTYYAGAAYCNPSQIWSWSCRAFQRELTRFQCKLTIAAMCLPTKKSTFKPFAAGGDGAFVQFCEYYFGSMRDTNAQTRSRVCRI